MDTLTQLTLGAACGEAILGKKIGNRAMLWGAFGGMLPDLDIVAYAFCDEMTALAFHRGFMHSILFAVLAAFGLGWLVDKLYHTGFYKRRRYKAAVFLLTLLVFGGVAFGVNYLPFSQSGKVNFVLLSFSVAALTLIGWLFWKKYLAADLQTISATRREWTWLFWWSIFTHPVLDSFTTFGTQLFQPFSDYRVAFNNIAVVDPAYTVPFLLCLLAASFISREKKARRILNWFGIGLSSAYMVFTLVHKWQFDRLFERSLAEQGIVTQRFTASPTILNNFLWQGMAESDTAYYHGMYSFFDKEPRITQFHVVPKNHELVAKYEGDRAMRILRWFSNGYFNVITRKDGKLQLNDLRYGSREERFEKETDYIFRFVLEEKDGKLSAHQTREGDEITGEAFQKLFNRILGKK